MQFSKHTRVRNERPSLPEGTRFELCVAHKTAKSLAELRRDQVIRAVRLNDLLLELDGRRPIEPDNLRARPRVLDKALDCIEAIWLQRINGQPAREAARVLLAGPHERVRAQIEHSHRHTRRFNC